MNMRNWFALLGLLLSATLTAQNVTISGYMRDAGNGEELISASIVNQDRQVLHSQRKMSPLVVT